MKIRNSINLIYLYSFTLPLGHVFQNIGLVFLLVFFLKNFKFKSTDLKQYFIFLTFTSFFLSNVLIDFFLNQEFHSKQLLGVIAPFLLLLSVKKLKPKQILFSILSISLSLAVVIILNTIHSLVIAPEFKIHTFTYKSVFSKGVFNYQYLYLSYYLISCLLALLYFNIKTPQGVNSNLKIISIGLSVLFSIVVLLLGSRTNIFIVLVMMLFFSYKVLKSSYSKRIRIVTLICVFFTSSFLLCNTNIINKTKELIDFKGQYNNLTEKWGGRFMRQEIWNCSIHLIQSNPIKGYGKIITQRQLNVCLATSTKNPKLYTGKYKFNAHNQFLQFWLTTGVVTLVLFVAFFLITLFISVNFNNYLYVFFIVICIVSFLTESVLERNHGIIFYSYIAALFFLKSEENEF